ncbi:B-cell receptor CD22-like isoform X1 [Acipenser ruthenus]|uniref:B-cell receptor CD22-like isoform X1 n=2 Tax=Acipenser ruthenus TaxID=7906 RepID=UPI0027404634|nr:B-cell receptor CD22-like isoform X1 [Acipenser ruthenus]XP_058865354.1 B-cell receptor CD22-like isoform X1 [Acipenser ruthenus]
MEVVCLQIWIPWEERNMVYLLMAILSLCGAADVIIEFKALYQEKEGSCVTIICSFKWPSMETGIWWKNPIYDPQTKDYNKTTVYHEDESIVDPEFKGRTEYLGDRKTNCSFKIKNLQLNDSGIYNFRFIGKNDYKWMNKQGVNLSVTENPCKIDIETPSIMTEGKEANLTCATKGPCTNNPKWQDTQDGWQFKRVQSDEIGKPRSETLTFTPTWWNHTKTLKCQIEGNKDECAARSVFLDIQYSPKETKVSSSHAEVKEGENVTLVCTSQGNPPVNTRWIKNGLGPIQNLTNKLKFDAIDIEDSGAYYCQASNVLGKENSSVINIDVKYKPKGTRILVAKEELNEGDSLTIECLFSSCNPNITSYTWYGNGKLVNPESGSTLEISDVTYQSDKYKYECEVKNEVGSSRSNPIILKVAYPPKETTAISKPADDIKEGAAVTLVCSCKGNPPVNFYTWFKVGQGIINNLETFEFNSISITDSGDYFCEAKNQLGAQNSSIINIDVKYAPKNVRIENSPQAGKILEGDELSLTCNTSGGNPTQISFAWYRNEHQTHARQTLKFDKITRDQAGSYYCEATNSAGSTKSSHENIDVWYGPTGTQIETNPLEKTIKVGQAMALTCSSRCNPLPSYSWYKHNSKSIDRLEATEKVLQFHKITVSEAGEYHCTAYNNIGAANSSSVTLNVLYAPINLNLSMESDLKEGDLAVIQCTVQSNPASYLSLIRRDTKTDWKAQREPLREELPNSIKLTFPSLRSEDAGIYACSARNSEGEITGDGELTVKYAPKDIQVQTPGDITEENTVILNCENHAHPPVSQYTWFKVTEGAVHNVGQERALQFMSISYKDRGDYFCNARNAIGEGNSSVIRLTLKFPPKNTTVLHNISAAGVTEGDTVILVCSCLSNPPAESFNWYRDAGNNRETPVSSSQNLTISDVTKANEGLYYCVAKNTLSSQTSEKITILVSYGLVMKAATSAAVLVVVLLICLVIVFICRWKQRKNTPGSQDGEDTCFKLINHMGTRNDTRENLVMDWVSDPQRSREDLSDGIHNPESLDYISSRQGRSRSQPPPSEAEVVYSTVANPAPAQKGRGTENPHWATRNNCQDQETLNYASLQFQGTSEQQKGSAGKERVRGKEAISDIYSTVCKPRKPTEQEKGDYENYKVPPGARKQKDDEDDCEELNYSTIVIPARVNKWESESDEEDEEEERTQYTHLKL